jgi:putative glutamine amidotransferase
MMAAPTPFRDTGSRRPVVGIICCTRQIGTEAAQAVINRYVLGAMRHAEADALLIPSLPALLDAGNVVARLDGLLLTGSPSNIAPGEYGDGEDGDGPFDPARDTMMHRLVDAAAAADKPLFGICRGFQEINVARGGTLRRDLGTTALPHHAPVHVDFDAMFDHVHPVALASGGLLASATGATELSVNSVHYQGVDRLGSGLAVEATAPDGQVEAFAGTSGRAPLLAVQWHPEWATDAHEDRRTFFHLLGRALRGAAPEELRQ